MAWRRYGTQPARYIRNIESTCCPNQPGARDGSMSWDDDKGNLCLYGGFGFPVNCYRFLNNVMIFSTSSTLPVLFSSFSAQKQQATVLLHWSTAQEQNSRSFIIERSRDGIVYSRIGMVAAAVTLSAPSHYCSCLEKLP